MAPTISGMVMNGPTPIMSIMFSAVAVPNPIPRMSGVLIGELSVGVGIVEWGLGRQWSVISDLAFAG